MAVRTFLPRTNYSSGRSLYEQARNGLAPIVRNLNNFIANLEENVLPSVVKEALEPTLRLSNVYVPKDTLRLMNSGYVTVNKKRGVVAAEIGYNRRGEAPYAIFVHEMPQFYHAPPTQYKFLQRAMDEDLGNIMSRIAIGVKKRSGL